MSEYYPKICERQTAELIEIANSSTKVWKQEAINQANLIKKKKYLRKTARRLF